MRRAATGRGRWPKQRSLLRGHRLCWHMDEASGFRMDATKHGMDLEDVNAPDALAGKLGDAVHLTAASSQFLRRGDSGELDLGNNDYTIAVWVYLDSLPAGTRVIYTKSLGNDDYQLAITVARQWRYFATTLSVTFAALPTVTTGTWYLAILWHDSVKNEVGLFVNGQEQAAAYTNTGNGNTGNLTVGSTGSSAYWDGRIDEMNIWDRVLTSEERRRLWNDGNGLAYPFGGDAATTEALRNGIWCWFTNPRAFHYHGTNDYTYIGHVAKDGTICMSAIDHDTKDVITQTLSVALQVDDHDHPSLLRRDSDSKLIAWYCKHNDTNMRQRISTNAEDIRYWGAETNIGAQLGGIDFAYSNPIQLLGELNDPIYLFYRADTTGARRIHYSTSTDGGATWAAGTELINDALVYCHFAQNGDSRIDVVAAQHPDDVAGDLYHAYYTAGAWYKSDGTAIAGGAPFDLADMTLVHDPGADRCWSWDIAIDGSGNPVIVYATFPTPASDHRYRYAHWTGAAWETHEICTAGGYLYDGNIHYSGGVCLDHDDINTVYASRVVSSQWEIYKYVTADHGGSWTETAITRGSAAQNCRPVVPWNSSADCKVVWWKGRYTTFTDYDTVLLSNPQY